MNRKQVESGYECWLGYAQIGSESLREAYWKRCAGLAVIGGSPLIRTAGRELAQALSVLLGEKPKSEAGEASNRAGTNGKGTILVGTYGSSPLLEPLAAEYRFDELGEEGYVIHSSEDDCIYLSAASDKGVLYAAFHFIRLLQTGESIDRLRIREVPSNGLRMINHWDNMDGSVERGYAGKSIFFRDGKFIEDMSRVRDYARLLASVAINAITINNVNVHRQESKLITDEFLPDVAKTAAIFRDYGIRLYLSVNFASPIEIGGLGTADPLDADVSAWWKDAAANIYKFVPDFGGFLVKADSEFRPGPFTYGRNHADGANMLADAIAPFGGEVIWRCFVYNCLQDWRDRKTDRARAAYDHFMPLDGEFRTDRWIFRCGSRYRRCSAG